MRVGSPLPRRWLALGEVGSTNSVAMDAARAGDPGSLWITAERQSAGRGRRGRPWSSDTGNLYASLLLIDPAPVASLGQLPLVIAVGMRRALCSLQGIDADRVRIKWPNDLLLDGAKCAGILVESERSPDGRQAVVVGCGLNVELCPDDAPYAVTTLRRAGSAASVRETFLALADGVEWALDLWRRGRHFSDIREEWMAGAAGLGQTCRVNLSDRTLEGRFADLDESGRLVLETQDARRLEISAGDVFLLPRPDASAAQ
ncbi:biotin--[acetyl-CoA-carboxylase] ligase [Aureimonas sp. AU40]|uniref:biotin--[acetyl-CoA-carboxylase] ligase n=1 Tax=Aureimonas sp. AU40 TaxID=1637747 RepID=UPI0007845295|nr:biotin--[acetyl-CoA-carboxylase] ligase [Aureimonas sp. AU40]